jgi:hypothetical protein
MYAETLDADFYRQRANFCYKLADIANASRPLYARLYFLAKAYEDKAKAPRRKNAGRLLTLPS